MVVGPSGLEPPTLRLSVVRSSQLSYGPVSTSAEGFIPSKLNNELLELLVHQLTRMLPSVPRYCGGLLRKEVIQPLVLERLPCYDFTPIIEPTFGRAPS